MTTYNETVIAQNAAIISLLIDIANHVDTRSPVITTETRKLIKISTEAQQGWLAQLVEA